MSENTKKILKIAFYNFIQLPLGIKCVIQERFKLQKICLKEIFYDLIE